MPSSHHVIVVQDIASRYPAAKLVSSTRAEKVLSALSEIYNTYGNPTTQISDNGPPFNGVKMEEFAKNRGIQLRKIPPYHPNANPAENFMRPLVKAMKIAHQQHISEKKALDECLNSYRQTPHPNTGIPPSDMLFRDGVRSNFPRKNIDEKSLHIKINLDQEWPKRPF